MVDYNFYGRPDGIGNRVDQIIMLEALCSSENLIINYVWTNKYAYRSYKVFLKSDRVLINQCSVNNKLLELNDNPEKHYLNFQHLSQREILNAAKKIRPTFDISFKNNVRPVGIHIRGTDRIGRNHDHFLKDYKEFNLYVVKTIKLINEKNPTHVFLCSDDVRYLKIIKKKLRKNIKVVKPIYDRDTPNEFVDFFALSLCHSVYMCSKYSTFAITASMIGNVPLIAYSKNDKISKKHRALFKYDTDFNDLPKKHVVKELNASVGSQIILKLGSIKKLVIKFIRRS